MADRDGEGLAVEGIDCRDERPFEALEECLAVLQGQDAQVELLDFRLLAFHGNHHCGDPVLHEDFVQFNFVEGVVVVVHALILSLR